jgi:diphosphomevalonate decarboxylase
MIPSRSIAHANIALVKYWGKRQFIGADLNLPAVGSLSLTLDGLRTITEVRPAEPSDSGADRFILDGDTVDGASAVRTFGHLDRLWVASGRSGSRPPTVVSSVNEFPTAAGLASSASGFAALTLAAAAAYGLEATAAELSALARRGSGSAARSIWGGFVRLDAGVRDDGSDCRAAPLPRADEWPVRILVVRTASGAKAVGSSTGMERTRTTSPYYRAWVEAARDDLDEAQAAIASRDLGALGVVTEHSCFKMHATMLGCRPPLMYWNGTTLDVIHAVWEARSSEGLQGYVTSDAGPHVKLLCLEPEVGAWMERLRSVPGVHGVEAHAPGPDARVEPMGDA